MAPRPNPPHHEIIPIPVGAPDRASMLEMCTNVRIDVFVHEQKFSLDEEIDEYDATATHFLLRLLPSNEPIGTIRAYCSSGATYYKLSRLAVLKEYRKYSFGRELVLALHDWVKQDATSRGLTTVKIVSHSQIPVKGFYAKFGYTPEGEEFDEDGAPHQKMILHLSLSTTTTTTTTCVPLSPAPESEA
ncbi:acyl-CoA N-acyltransferase [Stereum hirsutum FP-91666 SS1]|uniref:acyl-CoA N-acyltransferase n=1 Tax=Stereum hirsutum (strain FP-91666) TaxID=721885 RepID=UPI0004449E4C|nr:acyl-CoA N-acyltransferase [Stereum hirsutum FP-91666 SS1]EIM85726.1 acyl-CoA N-acyltransferase [Stereum hirsutum FP-91666 SS1]